MMWVTQENIRFPMVLNSVGISLINRNQTIKYFQNRKSLSNTDDKEHLSKEHGKTK